MIKKLLAPFIFTIISFIYPYHSFCQHQNVLISRINSPEEPSITMNFGLQNQLVVGANLDQYCYSSDSGATWSYSFINSSFGVNGDPCLISDWEGTFYYFHLSNPTNGNWLDRIVCQKSIDQGITWNDGSYLGYSGEKDQDKQWAVADFQNHIIYTTWTQFDAYGSSHSSKKSNILFSKSTDQGESWTEAKQINEKPGNCKDSDLTTEGAVPAVGPNGEVYVAWALNDSLYFDKSPDQGETWLENDIFIAQQPGGWDFAVPGIYRCNGLPVTCCDTSHSTYRGNIYVNWTDQRNGTHNTDVWLAKSVDGGMTWSNPTRVNDDSTETHQFLTWMTVDQKNGYLYFIYYDRRNYTDYRTDVYMALSKDGGDSFTNFKISEKPFYPREDVFFGDYTNIVAYNNIVRPIWTRLNYDNIESGLSIWTALVDMSSIGVNVQEFFSVEEYETYPNPVSHTSYYSFKLRKTSTLSLYLLNTLGQTVSTIINNETRWAGKYIEPVLIDELNLTPGIYFYHLITNNEQKIKKLIVVD